MSEVTTAHTHSKSSSMASQSRSDDDDDDVEDCRRKGKARSTHSQIDRRPLPFGSCRICMDQITGVHYGVPSCEGCKDFFKRSLLLETKYQCYFGNKCVINTDTHNRCKACRLKKCLEQGMSVDGIRMGRIPKLADEKLCSTNVIEQMKKLLLKLYFPVGESEVNSEEVVLIRYLRWKILHLSNICNQQTRQCNENIQSIRKSQIEHSSDNETTLQDILVGLADAIPIHVESLLAFARQMVKLRLLCTQKIMNTATPENLFWRNFDYANTIDYDLVQIYGEDITNVFETQAKFLLQDSRVLALVTTAAVAYFSSNSSILLDNCYYMEKGLSSYTLITTCSGSNKADTFSEISNVCSDIDQLETQFNSQYDDISTKTITKNQSKKLIQTNSHDNMTYVCDKVLNEFTGPGCIEALADHSNVLGLFDEFDDDSQTPNIFPSRDKFSNSMIDCKSFLQTVFSCPAEHIKATADRLFVLARPRLSIIGGSNGSILIEIIRKKMANAMIADPMVERFELASIRSTGTLVVNRLQSLPNYSIRVSFLLLFVHMVNGKKFIFNGNAQKLQKCFTDELTTRSLSFERSDAWLSVRFRKAREYSLRMCATLAIMKLSYQLAHQFILKYSSSFNSYDTMTIDLYKSVKEYINEQSIPSEIVIDEDTVESAHKATLTMILKYINLTSTNVSLAAPIIEVPFGPSSKSVLSLGITPVPSTQEYYQQQQQQQQQKQQIVQEHSPTTPPTIENNSQFKLYCKNLMMIDSIVFTRSSIHRESQLKKNLKYFDDAVIYLIEKKLLLLYRTGMVTPDGRFIPCYVKILPERDTPDAILEFSKVLYKIDVQYSLYISTFQKIWLPDRNKCSDEIVQLLNKEPYNRFNFIYKFLPSKSKATLVSSSSGNGTSVSTASAPSMLKTTGVITVYDDSVLATANTREEPLTLKLGNIQQNASSLVTNGQSHRNKEKLTSTLVQSQSSITINNNVPRLSTIVDESVSYATKTTTTISRSSSSESSTIEKELDHNQIEKPIRQVTTSSSRKPVVKTQESRNSRKRRK